MNAKYIAYTVAAMLTAASPAAAADIVETATSNGSFKTLTAALQAAGLVETLKGKGPYTVFAPSDEAFKKLPAGTVENLLKPENKAQLQKVLTYHVVAGNVMSSDLKGKKTSAKTVEGSNVQVDASGNAVKVNDATVTQADVQASNGVIHVIDSVIMPKS
ncbi:fasciclin domain-containing protein [Microvirga guangxiensis]|uniref:Uncaracterized surface protein containing fasciclin (FAS1) repeats n=1 Tax=Microvirga guangxiensis TaxID=549386 RepID=A0A1G5B8F5_9HYPH|nr:fasciclin domain-containing protein [Microvirga guangxiensis]SCX86484.1 Uncaracterized surface protein containing fasciclin (FAS1) repeats [Microvirga guangxiensis]